MSETCWADSLSRKERRELSTRLARACKTAYDTGRFAVARAPKMADIEIFRAHVLVSAEMSELQLDVTERAAVATA